MKNQKCLKYRFKFIHIQCLKRNDKKDIFFIIRKKHFFLESTTVQKRALAKRDRSIANCGNTATISLVLRINLYYLKCYFTLMKKTNVYWGGRFKKIRMFEKYFKINKTSVNWVAIFNQILIEITLLGFIRRCKNRNYVIFRSEIMW